MMIATRVLIVLCVLVAGALAIGAVILIKIIA